MAERDAQPAIERFRITRVLGTSARDGLYLAHDPVLDRQVAIRTLTDAGADAETRRALLDDARRLSRFRHPNIAPIFEAGDYAGGVYLVFEYVEGETLDRILARGPLVIDRALALMRELLDAAAAAHEQGVLHGALQPANVTVNADGHARITGLGMALPDAASSGESHLPDTPYYLAPEQLAGGPASERADVFSLGVLFYELLTGERAFAGAGPGALRRAMLAGGLEPPSRRAGNGDERFDALVLRATRPDPQDRFASAREFREALLAVVEGGGEPGDASSDFILRRIRRKPDFPGISSHIREITQCSDDTMKRSVAELSNAVLKDYATTQKLLRLANSPFYSNFGGNIRTVSRAIVLLGFEQVRTAALGLVLFENLKGGRHSGRLMEALVTTLFSAMLARDLADQVGGVETEQAFVCALFHDIGRMLVLYYLPEEADEIRIRVAQGTAEGSAARQVLGVSYEALARAVLQDWNFPREIVASVEPAPAGVLPAARDADQRLHRIVTLATEMGQCLAHAAREQQGPLLGELRRRYQQALGVDARGLQHAIQSGREAMDQFLAVVKLPPEGREPLQRLKANLGVRPEGDGDVRDAALLETEDAAAGPMGETPGLNPAAQAADLMDALTDMLDTMVGDFDLHTLVQGTLENLYRTLKLERVMLMLADREHRVLVAHTAFGRDAETLSGRLRLELSGKGDILSLAMDQQKDLVISDSHEASISRYIPDSFRQALDARSFLLLPLAVRQHCVGLLYLELGAGVTKLEAPVLRALKAVRNQLALAIRQTRD
ncbi:HDOD domain-containing protein [Thioalkalivibrio sp. ALJ16]|uniref:HDOD domain-containing protein n=1 Tax=Thioalkalivibrio sp. ALJ16 TaxID=1158762 RepID=UPI000370F300|nr:HDOD domain-containing protein [Thioalkalivibrio sp. ALJ16]